MFRKVVLLAAIALVLLFSGGCTSYRLDESEELSFDTPRTRSDIYSFDVQPGTEALKLNLEIETEEGKLNWTLTDPAGKRKVQGELNGKGSYRKINLIKSAAGSWHLRISTEEAVGKYNFRFTGH